MSKEVSLDIKSEWPFNDVVITQTTHSPNFNNGEPYIQHIILESQEVEKFLIEVLKASYKSEELKLTYMYESNLAGMKERIKEENE